jgi:hypothetical protein
VSQGTPHWTKYKAEEFAERLDIAVASLGLIYEGERAAPSGDKFRAESIAWLNILENISTQRLEWCFTQAARTWAETYPMKASYVLKVYEELVEQLRQGHDPQREVERAGPLGTQDLLPPGEETSPFDRDRRRWLSAPEWKALHGLPEDWWPGQPLPETSDLYGKEVPMAYGYNTDFDVLGFERPAYWWKSNELPWEQYPNEDAPMVKRIAIKTMHTSPTGYQFTDIGTFEFRWWVERCVEMDHPAVECPGYIREHDGVEGKHVTKKPCPFHKQRWDGWS